MKLVAILFGLFVLCHSSHIHLDQSTISHITVEEEVDVVEKFVINHLAPIYKHIKASHHLNMTIKAVLGFILVSVCIRVCLNIINGKDQDKDLIREIRDLKKQFNALKEEKTASKDSSIEEIKNELKSITKTLADNENLLKEKSKLDDSALDFQNEVLDSHKAIWTELRVLKRLVSHKRPAGVKIPPKEKPVDYCQSADLEGAQPESEPKTSLTACVVGERKKSSTLAPAQPKSLFAKSRKVSHEPESAQVCSAETKMEPDSGRQDQDESPSAPEAQTPMTKLIREATNTLSASIFDESPLKGDTSLTLKPLSKRLTIMSSKKIVANSPRPLVPQSVFN